MGESDERSPFMASKVVPIQSTSAVSSSDADCLQLDLDSTLATRLRSKNSVLSADSPPSTGRAATWHMSEEMERMRQQLAASRRSEAELLSEVQSLREPAKDVIDVLAVASEPVTPVGRILSNSVSAGALVP